MAQSKPFVQGGPFARGYVFGSILAALVGMGAVYIEVRFGVATFRTSLVLTALAAVIGAAIGFRTPMADSGWIRRSLLFLATAAMAWLAGIIATGFFAAMAS